MEQIFSSDRVVSVIVDRIKVYLIQSKKWNHGECFKV